MPSLPDADQLEDFEVDDISVPLLTVNISEARYEQYRSGNIYLSRDGDALPGEDAVANVQRLYAHHELQAPKCFTSLAVRWKGEPPRTTSTLRSYGEIVLVLKRDLFKEVVVFNGDVKDLAYALSIGNPKSNFVVGLPDQTWLATLVTNISTCQEPRLVGNYVEARLPRALTTSDILEVRKAVLPRPSQGAIFRRST